MNANQSEPIGKSFSFDSSRLKINPTQSITIRDFYTKESELIRNFR